MDNGVSKMELNCKNIYYNGNYNSESEDFRKSIYKEFEYFKRKSGLRLEMYSSYPNFKETVKNATIINAIINGKNCEQVIIKLQEDGLIGLIKSICVFTKNKNSYKNLQHSYHEIIKSVTTSKSAVLKFLKDVNDPGLIYKAYSNPLIEHFKKQPQNDNEDNEDNEYSLYSPSQGSNSHNNGSNY